jgi:uncharacterized delta-60 repeat protein
LIVQPDHRLLLAGSISYSGTGNSVFAAARYSPTGSLDPKFGNNGFVTTDLTGALDEAFAAAVQKSGRIILAGYAAEPSASDHDFAVTRYLFSPKFVINSTSEAPSN